MANVPTGCNQIKRSYDECDAFASYHPNWDRTQKLCKMPSKKDDGCMLDTDTGGCVKSNPSIYSKIVRAALKMNSRDVPKEHEARENQTVVKTTRYRQEDKKRAPNRQHVEAFKTFSRNREQYENRVQEPSNDF